MTMTEPTQNRSQTANTANTGNYDLRALRAMNNRLRDAKGTPANTRVIVRRTGLKGVRGNEARQLRRTMRTGKEVIDLRSPEPAEEQSAYESDPNLATTRKLLANRADAIRSSLENIEI